MQSCTLGQFNGCEELLEIPHGLNYKIPMLSVLLHSLRWWSLASNLTFGLPFLRPPHTHVITTDVSLGGWGGHLKKIGMI